MAAASAPICFTDSPGSRSQRLRCAIWRPTSPLLFARFAGEAAARHGRPLPDIPFALRGKLARHAWPGNARELRGAAERFVLGLGATGTIDSAPVDAVGDTLAERLAAFEAREIRAALDQCRGNTERAAQLLGIPRRTLNDKMKRLDIRL